MQVLKYKTSLNLEFYKKLMKSNGFQILVCRSLYNLYMTFTCMIKSKECHSKHLRNFY